MEKENILLKPMTPEEVSGLTDEEVIQKPLEMAEARNFWPAMMSLRSGKAMTSESIFF